MNPDTSISAAFRRLLLLALSGLILASCQPSANEAGQTTGTRQDSTAARKAPSVPLQNRPVRDLLQVESPAPDDAVSSPLTIRGQARGYWFFEGDFPVQVQDEEGHMIAQGIAQAKGEWMTEEWVPFEATITFKPLDQNRGYLYFEKANPSGLKENEKSFRMPIVFAKSGEGK